VPRHVRVSTLRVVDDDDVGLRTQARVVDRAECSIGCAVVAEGHPGERPLVTQRPFGGKRRLAVAGGTHDQHDGRVAADGQSSQQVRSGHGSAAQRRRRGGRRDRGPGGAERDG
jgi:hypothetical protein